MKKIRLLIMAAGVSAVAALALLQGAEKPNYLFWTAVQMNAMDKKLESTLDASKGSRIDMMSTEHSFFMVTHRESNSTSGEVHTKYGDFAVVRSGDGGVLAGGTLANPKQTKSNEIRGKIEGGKLYRLKPGDVYYVPAGVPHQTIVEPGKHLRVEMLKVERKEGFKDLPEFQYWDAALMSATEQTLKKKMNKYFSSSEDFIKNENTQFHMNHKEGTAESEIHDHWDEFQIIRNGEATMMLGGKVVKSRQTGPGEIRGSSLDGATAQPLRPGDLMLIPAGMPHHTVIDKNKLQDKLIIKVWRP